MTKYVLITRSGDWVDMYNRPADAIEACKRDASGIAVEVQRWDYRETAEGTHEIVRKGTHWIRPLDCTEAN